MTSDGGGLNVTVPQGRRTCPVPRVDGVDVADETVVSGTDLTLTITDGSGRATAQRCRAESEHGQPDADQPGNDDPGQDRPAAGACADSVLAGPV